MSEQTPEECQDLDANAMAYDRDLTIAGLQRKLAAMTAKRDARVDPNSFIFSCQTHGTFNPVRQWGCPDCMAEARRLLAAHESRERALREALQELISAEDEYCSAIDGVTALMRYRWAVKRARAALAQEAKS